MSTLPDPRVSDWSGIQRNFDALQASSADVSVIREAPLNLRDTRFGGIGNGSSPAQDTAAIQKAHDALPASGGEILIPTGTWDFGGSTAMPFTKPTHLVGMGRGVSTIRNTNTTGQHFLWMQADRSGARDLTIDGRRTAQTVNGGSAIIFARGGGGVLAPVLDGHVRDCEVLGNGFDAIGMVNAWNVTVRDTVIREVFDTGIDIVEGSRSIDLVGNKVYCNGRFGIALDTSDASSYPPVERVHIKDNTVVMQPGTDVRYGILLQTARDCDLAGNDVDISAAGTQGIRFDNEFLRGSVTGGEVICGPATTRGICVEGLVQQRKMVTIGGGAVVRDVTAAGMMGIGVESGIGVDVSHCILENCKRGIDFEGSSTRPVQGVSAAFNNLWNCDIGVRFGGTTGPNTATVGPNWMGGSRSFRYAFDAGWAVHSAGEWDTSAMFGSFA